MPDVPKLEDCELEEDLFRRRAMCSGIEEKVREVYLIYAAVREMCFCRSAVFSA